MNKIKRFVSVIPLVLLISLLFENTDVLAISGAGTYTYNYDCWIEERESPDAYSVSQTFSGSSIEGCTNFLAPESLYVLGNRLYVVDTGNNRIVELEYNDSDSRFHYIREFKEFMNEGKKDTFNKPKDCFVQENGDILVADYGNQRIVHVDKNGNAVKVIVQPVDEAYDSGTKFLPTKLVVDRADRVFTIVENINKGFLEFDKEGTFIGYMGASEVEFNPVDYIWKMIATEAQREQMNSFVPTEYHNLTLDDEDFIYATITKFEGDPLDVKPIRKLNAKGTDILTRNGYFTPSGDLFYASAEVIDPGGPSKLFDICALPNDTYFCLDYTRGRIFGYDFQGNLLYAFGGRGYRKGYFINAVALEDMNDSLLVLDSKQGTVTQFNQTTYGALISQGLVEYKIGDYEASAETWKKVMRMNGNYDLAYIGIGRALLRTERYKEAMEYFKLKLDDDNYSKAFKYYRKEWMEDNIGYVVVVLVILIILAYGRGWYKKAKKEVSEG